MNRDDFPILDTGIIYFDNGATTLKPKCVIDEMNEYYLKYSANIHRGDYEISIKASNKYEQVRDKVAHFINAKSPKEIVFTSGDTMALNMVVFGYMAYHLDEGDEILVTKSEHASLILPWMELAKSKNLKIKYIPLNDEHELDLDAVCSSITNRTKVISLAYITNVVGDLRNIKEICRIAHEHNILVVVDGAQSVPHMRTDVVDDDIDFLIFSGHKMLGPTGVGVLYGKKHLLDEMYPITFGGGMNQYFEEDGDILYKSVPIRFEAGTVPIAEVIGLGKAIDYLESIGMDNIYNHEVNLKKYLLERLEKYDNVIIYNKNSKSGILSFNLKNIFSQDTAIYLDKYNICVRAGNHCAKILKDEINIKNTCRLSLYLYNTKEEIDKFIEAIDKSNELYKVIL